MFSESAYVKYRANHRAAGKCMARVNGRYRIPRLCNHTARWQLSYLARTKPYCTRHKNDELASLRGNLIKVKELP